MGWQCVVAYKQPASYLVAHLPAFTTPDNTLLDRFLGSYTMKLEYSMLELYQIEKSAKSSMENSWKSGKLAT